MKVISSIFLSPEFCFIFQTSYRFRIDKRSDLMINFSPKSDISDISKFFYWTRCTVLIGIKIII